MEWTTPRVGRPYFVAEIDFLNDSALEFRDEFYRACAEFHYRDIMALSRALRVDPCTVSRWKYKVNFPRWWTAMLVIDWVKRGKPIDPGVLSHNFARIAKQAGLQNVRFHDLRHTFASLMLLRGAKPKVISEALGHSSVAFTMDVYSHIIEGMQSEAMAFTE